MSILLKDFNGAELIPFVSGQEEATKAILIISYLNLWCGLFLEAIVLSAIGRLRHKSVDMLFTASLCCADFVYNFYLIIEITILLYSNGWSTGMIGCRITATMINIGLGISIFSLSFITLNRYLSIIWKYNISRLQALLMIFSIWIDGPIIGVLLFYYAGEYLNRITALQSSHLYCLLEYSSNDPEATPALLSTLIFVSIPMIFLIFAYSSIIIFYVKANRSREFITSEVSSCFHESISKTIHPSGIQIRETTSHESNGNHSSLFRNIFCLFDDGNFIETL